MIGDWSEWQHLPHPKQGGYLIAPIGPGVYELWNRKTGDYVCPGMSKYVAWRMTSLFPTLEGGCSGRENEAKRQYVAENCKDIVYRTLACVSEDEAKEVERKLKKSRKYLFPR